MLKKQALIFVIILLFSSFSYAANWYRVELVVFEHLNPYTGGEVFDGDDEYPVMERSVDLIEDIPGDESGLIAFKSIQRGTLSGVYTALKVSSQYRPIMHMAWQQPGMNGPNARRVHVKLDDGFKTKVDGSVRIRSGHFLYVDVDLAYFLDALTTAGADAETLNQFTRMLETRKIKLNELHYFDHPLFGVVMRVGRL